MFRYNKKYIFISYRYMYRPRFKKEDSPKNNQGNGSFRNGSDNKLSWADRVKQPSSNTSKNPNSEGNIFFGDPGKDIKLSSKYVLWTHDLFKNDWSINSYKKLCTIDNVSSFWKLFNNFNKLGFRHMHFFFMKEGIDPIWEHDMNRNGGICSFKIDIESSLDIWELLGTLIVCDNITDNPQDINGLSISPKNSWALVKIWNKDKNNDLTDKLPKELTSKYPEISVIYKPNEPEY